MVLIPCNSRANGPTPVFADDLRHLTGVDRQVRHAWGAVRVVQLRRSIATWERMVAAVPLDPHGLKVRIREALREISSIRASRWRYPDALVPAIIPARTTRRAA